MPVLCIDEAKHALKEGGKEPVEHVSEVKVPALVVALEVEEELGEHLRVLLVLRAVRPPEHQVKVQPGLLYQLYAELCTAMITN